MSAIAAFVLGGFVGICLGIGLGIFLVFGTLSLQALEEREAEGYPPVPKSKASARLSEPDSVWKDHGT